MSAPAPGDLEQFRLERYFARHEFDTPFLLGSSDCESMTIAALLALEAGAERAFLEGWLGYTESRGAPGLRAEIAGLYTTIGAENVLVHAGAEEAIYAFVRAVLRPGERVVVQVPCYQSLTSVARNQGCDVVRWQPASDPQWRWSIEELERLATPATRALFVNSPHNPTGHQFAADAFTRIARLAEQRGALLFSDEVYRLSELDGPPLPAACDLSENGVSLGVLSKSFGLPGLRIGWIATRNAAVLERVAAYKDYLTICNSAPSEFLAALALRRREAILSHTKALLRENRGLVDAFFGRHAHSFAWSTPSAGPIAFVRLKGGMSAEALCASAVRAGVLLVPSTQFEYGDEHIRVGFGRRNLPAALARFEAVVEQIARGG
jgi:aspartate/methionine/tyrosine aminotransferase